VDTTSAPPPSSSPARGGGKRRGRLNRKVRKIERRPATFLAFFGKKLSVPFPDVKYGFLLDVKMLPDVLLMKRFSSEAKPKNLAIAAVAILHFVQDGR
jgi:hypothetical protein